MALENSSRPLSGTGTGPAEVSFSPDGRNLVVTEKATNLLDVFPVDSDGLPSQLPNVITSAGKQQSSHMDVKLEFTRVA